MTTPHQKRRSPSAVAGTFLVLFCLSLMAAEAHSQGIPLITSAPDGAGGTSYTAPVQTLLALTALSFLPAALMLMTSFARILIVFSLLRQALGLQGVPPNTVLIGLALFLTFFIMNPTINEIYQNAYIPLQSGDLLFEDAALKASEPLKAFMLANTRVEELALFSDLYGGDQEIDNYPLAVIVPAFALSEIKTAFLIGFFIYLPFLAIDFAVASVLTSLGMIMVSPMMFSLPLKLVIFVLADGWVLLGSSLVNSFASSTGTG